MCFVHIRAHTNLVAGGRRHTCIYHTLTVSLLLTQTLFEHVQTDRTYIDAHTLQGHSHHCRLQAWTLSALRQRDRKTEKEISGSSDVCFIYTPTSSSLSQSLSSFSPILSCKFSSLSAPLAVLRIDMQTFFPSLSALFPIRYAGCAFVHMALTALTCKLTHTTGF